MSLSKSIKHCRRCVRFSRGFSESGSGAASKMNLHSNFSAAQLRMLGNIRELLGKGRGALSKEWGSLLQKIHPAIYAHDDWKAVLRSFDNSLSSQAGVKSKADEIAGESVKDKVVDKIVPVTQESNEIQQQQQQPSKSILEGLGFSKSADKNVTAVWRSLPASNQTSIDCLTKHVVYSLATAEGDQSIIRRTEELCNHINQYPTERSHAVKIGAIRILLRIRNQSKTADTTAWANEALALIGHSDPLPGRGVRILSIDGGGIRGVLVIEMLRKLEQLTGKRVFEMFDYISGVSTGAILSCVLGTKPDRTLDQISHLYKDLSAKVFDQSGPLSLLSGTSRLVWNHAYYDTSVWENMLRQFIGETPLIKTNRVPGCPKISALSCVINASHLSAYVFRNYNLPWRVQSVYPGSHDARLWEVVRASSAAPTYFEEFRLKGMIHQDGGIVVNNPTAVAIHEARQLWPGAPIQCVVSFGTGRTHPIPPENDKVDDPTSSSWKTKFMKILDSATDTEAVHTMLTDLLPPNTYFRFNPYLTEMITMAEIRPEKVSQLERDAQMYARRNEDKFEMAARAICETKPITQKSIDWLKLQVDMLGVK